MSDNNQSILIKAREFARKCILRERKQVTEEDYFMFVISKFLLLKESIIKKDSGNKIIYFVYEKGERYLPAIRLIVQKMTENCQIPRNGTRVIIIGNNGTQINNPELENDIWLFNYLRDTLSHGAYDFNIPYISCTNTRKNIHFDLPIETLEIFSYIADNENLANEILQIDKMIREINKIREEWDFLASIDPSLIKKFNAHIYNLEEERREKLETVINEETQSELGVFENDSPIVEDDTPTVYKMEESEKMPDLKATIKEQEDTFEQMILSFRNSQLSEENKEKVYRKYEAENLIKYEKKSKKVEVKKSTKFTQTYYYKLATAIREMATIMGLSESYRTRHKVTSLYNYMQLVLNIKNIRFTDPTFKSKLAHIQMSKLQCEFFKNSNGEFISPKGRNVDDFKKSIIERTKDFIRKILIDNPNGIVNFEEEFSHYYEDILTLFAEKNAIILTSIRNSIAHANISEKSEQIKLVDKLNQFDNSTTHFQCVGDAETLFDITQMIESDTYPINLTLEDFLGELEVILPQDLFKNLKNTLKLIKSTTTYNEIEKENMTL